MKYIIYKIQRCCMQNSAGINISPFLIFNICKQPTICFKFIRPHYVCCQHLFILCRGKYKKIFDTVLIELQKISQWYIQ